MTDLRLVTYQELAVAWHVSVRTVQRWIAQDRAQGHQIRHCRVAAGRYGQRTVLHRADADAVLLRRFPSLG